MNKRNSYLKGNDLVTKMWITDASKNLLKFHTNGKWRLSQGTVFHFSSAKLPAKFI